MFFEPSQFGEPFRTSKIGADHNFGTGQIGTGQIGILEHVIEQE
jgi:hypothetical protein